MAKKTVLDHIRQLGLDLDRALLNKEYYLASCIAEAQAQWLDILAQQRKA